MNVAVHSHKIPLSPDLKLYAEEKIRRLDRHFDRVMEARLDLDLDGRKSNTPGKVATLHVHVSGAVLQATEHARGWNEVVDLVVDKIDEQLRRRKERLTDHRSSLPVSPDKPR